MSWIGVVTNGGNALIAQWAGGARTLNILGATVGAGFVPEANMRIATALADERDDAYIAESKDIENGVRLRIRVTPTGGIAYVAHEIGIWADIDGGTRTLISLHQDAVNGIAVPTETESPEFAFDLIVILTIENDGSLNVTIAPSVYVTNQHWLEGRAEDDKGLYVDEEGYLCQRITGDET